MTFLETSQHTYAHALALALDVRYYMVNVL